MAEELQKSVSAGSKQQICLLKTLNIANRTGLKIKELLLHTNT